MNKSEYYIAHDGNIYWGSTTYSIMFPILGVGEISYFGTTLAVESAAVHLMAYGNATELNLN